jgi:uncharacterized damage-inducible protein DinB
VTAKSAPSKTFSTVLIEQWEQAGRKLIALAEEIPESHYDWRPKDEIRTVGDVLRHVAFWNQYVAAIAEGKQADDQGNELPKKDFATKTKILDAVRKSLAEATNALRRLEDRLDPAAGETVIAFIAHNAEHYGQLAVYARLNGVVPPASRV